DGATSARHAASSERDATLPWWAVLPLRRRGAATLSMDPLLDEWREVSGRRVREEAAAPAPTQGRGRPGSARLGLRAQAHRLRAPVGGRAPQPFHRAEPEGRQTGGEPR